MDFSSAIGVASGIIAFIDFGCKLLSKSKEIYKSASGSTSLNDDLSSEARRLQIVTDGLQMPGLAGSLSGQELALQELATECSIISSDLSKLINDLKTRNPKSKRESLRAAYRDWRKKDEKDELQSKFDRCKNQLNLQIISLFRTESSDQLKKLLDYGQASNNELQSLLRNVEQLQASCKVSCLNSEALEQIRSTLGQTEAAVVKIRQARILDGLRFLLMNERYENIKETHGETFSWILDDESEHHVVEERSNTETNCHIDYSFDGSSLDDDDPDDADEYVEGGEEHNDDNHYSQRSRNTNDSNSYKDDNSIHRDDDSGFEWREEYPDPPHYDTSETESSLSEDERSVHSIVPAQIKLPTSLKRPPLGRTSKLSNPDMIESRDRFITWLKQGDRIFHIIGKPGSGKSTLMKYICRQPTTEKHLQVWAGNLELVIGKFFFWRPGSSLQNSLKGLVRGLLYCFLDKSPELIPKVFPRKWQESKNRENVHIEQHECEKGFECLISTSDITKKHKFVFFIDGLDEFEGDHAELIRKLFLWTDNYQNIKICVSSREWSIFQARFRDCPKLWLHILTHLDIQCVVRDRLCEMDLSSLLQSTDDQVVNNLDILEREILKGSDGVFLWVTIVLRHIEGGIENGDQMEDLLRILRCLPTELEPLMSQLINSIPANDKKLAYATLSFALFAHKYDYEIPLMQFSLLEEYIKDKNFPMGKPVGIYPHDMATRRRERASKRIYGLCKGFLELRPNPHLDTTGKGMSTTTNLLGDVVRFTHRSVVEFLESQPFKEMAQFELQDFEPSDANIQTYLGLLRCLRLPRIYFAPKFKKSGFSEYGLTLGLRELVAIWFPDHSNTLREIIDWNREIGVSFDENQRIRSLQSKFGRALRPLFDEDHPDFIGWGPLPGILYNVSSPVRPTHIWGRRMISL
ncbi:hypothetical protein F4805DRAFT_461158 [Annulohypoxylon moriforme]|nr:hypothetical protein F4805DRAFT_461158 [Annulohypoxylon moriforme]